MAVDNQGRVLGAYIGAGAFLYQRGDYAPVIGINPTSINERGQIAGVCNLHPCLWEKGVVLDLTDGTATFLSSGPRAINNRSELAGTALLPGSDYRTRAYLWSPVQ